MVSRLPVWKLSVSVVVVMSGAAISIPLGRYAERDDAPGGVVIAGLIMIGALLLAAWIVKPRPAPGARK